MAEETKKEQAEEAKTPAKKVAKASTQQKKTAKKTRVQTHGKKYLEAQEQVEKNKQYGLTEAIELAKSSNYTKFPATLELHINTPQKNLRGLVTLPHAAGKKLTVLAFGKGAAESGADLVGTDETIAQLEKSKINFDVLVTTPEWMPRLARLARILGPKGLMPNPKSGTITDNLAKAVSELQSGKTEYRTEPNGSVIHLAVGKATQPTTEISANIKALFGLLGKSRVRKMTLAPTMGPGVKIDPSSI